MCDTQKEYGLWYEWLFLAFLSATLVAYGQVSQATAHYFFDGVSVRDTGTTFPAVFDEGGILKIITHAFFHNEGPLQYVLLNVYSFLASGVAPLSPSTLQLPNTVFAIITAIIAYMLGKELVSSRAGLYCAAVFASAPWLAFTIRVPWYFNTLSCMLQMQTVYSYLAFVKNSQSRHRIIAPIALSVYLLTGLDWPIFAIALVTFVVLCGRVKTILFNPYNGFPLAVLALYVLWVLALHINGYDYRSGVLLYWLQKADGGNIANYGALLENTLLPWGVQGVVAVVGLSWLLRMRPKESLNQKSEYAFYCAMVVWLIVGGLSIAKTSKHISYLYVVAVPSAVLAGAAMGRLKPLIAGVLIVAMFSWQLHYFIDRNKPYYPADADGQHVLAAAVYLNEIRPDLLGFGKTALVPRDQPANVSHYARGANHRIVMPRYYPDSKTSHSVSSDSEALLRFVETYESTSDILADWVILESTMWAKGVKGEKFWSALKDDPKIHWIASFQDPGGSVLYLGEVVKRQGTSMREAPSVDVAPLVAKYRRDYDRYSFLKRNVSYIWVH